MSFSSHIVINDKIFVKMTLLNWGEQSHFALGCRLGEHKTLLEFHHSGFFTTGPLTRLEAGIDELAMQTSCDRAH